MTLILWMACPSLFDFEEDELFPGDLDLKVKVDRTTRPGFIEDPLPAQLVLTVINRSRVVAEGHVIIEVPPEMGGGKERIPFILEPESEVSAKREILLPQGASRKVVLLLSIFSRDRFFLGMDLILTKVSGLYVIGPFEGNTETGLERLYPPEESIDLDGVYEGKEGRKLRWQPLNPAALQAQGYHDLNAALGFHENATAYAYTSVKVPHDTEAMLRLGSDDGIKVWLNHELVHTHAVHRGSMPGQDKVSLVLREGRNDFLLKVCNDDGGWGFHFDLVDSRGEPLKDIKTEVGVAPCFIHDTDLRMERITQNASTLTWKSDLPVKSVVTWVEAERTRTLVYNGKPKDKMIRPLAKAEERRLKEEIPVTTHSVTLSGLKPGTRYLAWAEPALAGDPTPAVAFYTSSEKGKTQYLVLKLAAVFFTATTPPKDQDRDGARAPCPETMIDQVKREMEQTVLFYWITTGMRLFLDVEYFVVDDFYAGLNHLYGVGYGGEDNSAFEKALKEAGRSVDEFDGRLILSMEKQWDEEGKKWYYPVSGGGTIGPESWPGYGMSAWKGGSDNAWLFCHEFQHQLDALYAYSHGPEHLFCHFQPWDDTAHRHGEHWDGISWIFLEWAGFVTRYHQGRPYLSPDLGYRYFLNRWGQVITSLDQDEDGIPDRDPLVPLDEKRLGSNPQSPDSDGDGLSDMMEVLASHGVEYGHGEIWAGDPESHQADLTLADTDGDGLKDGKDPYPLYAIDPDVPKGNPHQPFAAFRDRMWEGDFTLGWDDRFLYLGLASTEIPKKLKIYLDFDDNGWFQGADNYDIRVEDGVAFEARFHNCGAEGKWPFYEEGRLEKGRHVFFESEIGKDHYHLGIKVARSPEGGLDLVAGEKIGILIAVQPKEGNGRPGRRGDLTLFEPHTFFTFTLNE